ncbi:hypothetical protein ANN_10954, partial [Periplaneta americana]
IIWYFLRVSRRKITLHELLEIMESSETIPNSGVDVALLPSLNANDDLTDEDSDAEDNPCIDNLPASQLSSDVFVNDMAINNVCEKSSYDTGLPSEPLPGPSPLSSKCRRTRSTTPSTALETNKEDITGTKATKKKDKGEPVKAGSTLPSTSSTMAPPTLQTNKEGITGTQAAERETTEETENEDSTLPSMEWPLMYEVPLKPGRSPLEYFTQFFDEEILNMMVTYTNQYAAKKNRVGDCSENEMMVFLAVLLLSGYVVVPRRRMYWQGEQDSHNELVSNAISRDRFDFIMMNLHVCDNDDLEKSDRFAKIRMLLSMLNERFQHFGPHERHHSIDESMVPYFGRHGCKQFIKGKPIWYGFKFWCGGTSNGYFMWLEPYQGAGTCSQKYEDKGLGYGVVISYADQLRDNVPYRFFFDNLFTNVQLLIDLKKRGNGATGTMQQNHIAKSCTLSPADKIKKEKRGTHEAWSDKTSGITIVKWNDNSVVTIATNYDEVFPLKQVGSFSREKKRRIAVPQPRLFESYNSHMGGIDRGDQNVSLYRTSIRGKKWYFPIIAHLIDVAEQNTWLLYRRNEKNIDHLSFRR